MALEPQMALVLAVLVGTFAAIVYCIKIVILMERRIARIDYHIDTVVQKILKEEIKIEKQEQAIAKRLKR